MASSFGEAFAKSFQAEMARRKDAEAEIEREIRAEARLNREMQERRAINTESELAQEARAIEAERRREERADKALSESRLYDKREKSLAKEEEINRRLAAVKLPRVGEGSGFQPIESQYGIPPTQEELIALSAAERKLTMDETVGLAGAREKATIGAREQVREEEALARAMGQFGEDAASKPRGFWPRYFAEEDREKAIKTTQFLQDREGTIKLLPKVPRHVLEANKDIWFDSEGALNRKGTYAIPKGFGQIKVEGVDEFGVKTGRDHYESVWIPDVPRADSTRPPESGPRQGPPNQPPASSGGVAPSPVPDRAMVGQPRQLSELTVGEQIAREREAEAELQKRMTQKPTPVPPSLQGSPRRIFPTSKPALKPWSQDYFTR